MKKFFAVLTFFAVLYGGSRGNTKSHLATAHEHGWTYAPIDILDADGERIVPYKGKYFNKVIIGRNMDNYGSFLVVSHFKGHSGAGFGGAIKNLAMGFASISGKKAQHISIKNYWMNDNIVLQEKMAEYARGVTTGRKMTYINLLMNISADCDCHSDASEPFIGDIGILASNDPVAIDQASYDLVNKTTGLDDTFKHKAGISGLHCMEYAETIGLGTRKYKLIEIK